MKKLFILICTSLLFAFQASGQTWFTLDLSGRSGIIPVMTRLTDGNFAAAVANDDFGIDVMLISPSGDFISAKKTKPSLKDIYFLSSIYELPSGDFLISGTATDTMSSAEHDFFLTLDYSTGEAKWAIQYVFDGYSIGPYYSVTSDAIYTVNAHINTPQMEKFDHDLNTLSCFYAVYATSAKNPSFSILAFDSCIITINKNTNAFGYSKFSQSGGFLDYVNYGNPFGSGYTRMYSSTKTSDAHFVVAGLNGLGWSSGYAPIIAKIAQTGTVLWCNRTDDSVFSRFTRVLELPSGEIAAFGRVGPSAEYGEIFDGVCIFSESGILLRSYVFGNADTEYKFTSVQVNHDGILLCGIITDSSGTYNTAIFTDFNFSQVCHLSPVTVNSFPASLGTETHQPESAISISAVSPSIKETLPMLTVVSGSVSPLCASTTGLTSEQASLSTISPNPITSGDVLKLNMTVAGDFTVHFSDMKGKVVSAHHVSGSSAQISTSGLTTGMYHIQVLGASAVSSHKLIVR